MLESQEFTLAELATNLDYADQSHLIRNFNECLGVTPKQYAKNTHFHSRSNNIYIFMRTSFYPKNVEITPQYQ
ncbi:AraC family transcriptional regulator [Paraglaciecola sp. MB-3u-78]|uniref:AraC family transcriptional regulator n=1 Tax=Paraglaciecola sp. MB-3u-78 TaxID=2058332 RepID=UPI003510B41D